MTQKIKKLLRFQNKHFRKILIIDAALIIAAIGGIVAFSEPAPVQGLKVDECTYSSVSLSWEGSEDADGYRVYRSEDGKDYKYVESTVESAYKDMNLRTGTNYYYLIAARNGFNKSKINPRRALRIIPSLETPTLNIDTSKGKMQLNISDVKGAAAYEITRDGEKIGESEENTFIDESAEPDKKHKYEVKAVRYKKNPVYSTASKVKEAELHQIPNVELTTTASDIVIKWDESEHYDNYKLYNGNDLLTETVETSYTLEDFKTDTIYDIKMVGYKEEDGSQSPEIEKRIKIFEEPLDNEGARQAACDWGVMIAEDDSFAYGTGSRAHRCGCYFCGTNGRKGSGYGKTYCCNPFVNACYAHGAGDPQVLRLCKKGDSVGMNASDYTNLGNWERHSKPSVSELRMGDVLVGSHHVMLYIGDGQIVHAAGEGWGASSIRTDNCSSYYSFCDFVMRYTGTGSGTMYKIRDVDEKGNVIKNATDTTEEESSEKEDEAA